MKNNSILNKILGLPAYVHYDTNKKPHRSFREEDIIKIFEGKKMSRIEDALMGLVEDSEFDADKRVIPKFDTETGLRLSKHFVNIFNLLEWKEIVKEVKESEKK